MPPRCRRCLSVRSGAGGPDGCGRAGCGYNRGQCPKRAVSCLGRRPHGRRDHFEHTALPKDFKVATPEDITGFDKETLERISQMKSSQLVISPDEIKGLSALSAPKQWIDFDDILREALLLLEDENIAANCAVNTVIFLWMNIRTAISCRMPSLKYWPARAFY